MTATPLATESPTTAGRSLITARSLYKVFPSSSGPVLALDDVSFDIRAGEFVSLVGPSGCGKSTLLNIIGGLLHHSRGELRYAGEEHSQPRREFGMMFQTPLLLPWRTVLKNVMLPVEVLGLRKAEAKTRAEDLLTMVGLSEFAGRYPAELSGGMKQRVALCRLLVSDPEVLLMDEPFGALDEFTREAMNAELLRVWAETKKTAIFVTHNISEAVFLSDRVFVMTPRPGRLAGVVEIDLPRPRTEAIWSSPELLEYTAQIRGILGGAH
ncbi:ABC transporter ATP-binding protein [Mycolicibacterium baixiangningiae]|uniref:ABC transporter ATP-binding protein n=1 Tax=Mycolicibacterium baixiangningiae TaxID=2761578 RepID=UPI0018D0F101|nr:ABC transporter ATP-binding protein [Mycolicibacterium baixiangningiae]